MLVEYKRLYDYEASRMFSAVTSNWGTAYGFKHIVEHRALPRNVKSSESTFFVYMVARGFDVRVTKNDMDIRCEYIPINADDATNAETIMKTAATTRAYKDSIDDGWATRA